MNAREQARSLSLGWCDDCLKLSYADRKTARQVARLHKEEHKSVYQCEFRPQLWHVGGLPDAVMKGSVTRGEWYGR